MNRIVANSENLKKTFPEVYEVLFSKSSVVASAPGTFWWVGEHGVFDGNLGIIQKLPWRVYVGIEPTKSGEAKIGSFNYFSPEEHKFKSGFLGEPAVSKLFTFLKEQSGIKKGGVILHLLFEVPPKCGLNSSGAFALAMATSLNLYWENMKSSEVGSWKGLDPEVMLANKYFHENLLLAWKFESIFHGDLTSGCTILAPAIDGDYPVICFPPKQNLDKVDDYWNDRYRHLDSLKISGARLNEFFKFRSLPSWSFDFGLIYSGNVRPTAAVTQTAIARRAQLSEVLTKAKLLPFTKPYELPGTKPWQAYMDALKTDSLEVLLNFKEVFEKGLSESVMKNFFHAINRYQDLLNTVTVHSAAIEAIQNHLRQVVFDYGDEFGIATKISGGGLRGDILFVSAYHAIKDNIDRILDSINQTTSYGFYLDYASWLDGFERQGIVVEQELETKNYSEFISPGSVFIKHFSSDGFIHTDIWTRDRFEREKGRMSLILDPLEHEIWIREKKLTSKEIPTSVATIQILKTLLEKIGKEVANNSIHDSHYVEDRNELQSKIISPLNKILKKELGKELPISNHGSLDEFSVKLSSLPFSIYLIEKVF